MNCSNPVPPAGGSSTHMDVSSLGRRLTTLVDRWIAYMEMKMDSLESRHAGTQQTSHGQHSFGHHRTHDQPNAQPANVATTEVESNAPLQSDNVTTDVYPPSYQNS
jgi:hypothetical protein